MKTLIGIILVFGLINCTDETIKVRSDPSLEGNWEFESTTFKGEFTIKLVNNTLKVTKGNYSIREKQYQVEKETEVTKDWINLVGTEGNQLVLLNPIINDNITTIVVDKVEYDTDDGPTILITESILILRI